MIKDIIEHQKDFLINGNGQSFCIWYVITEKIQQFIILLICVINGCLRVWKQRSTEGYGKKKKEHENNEAKTIEIDQRRERSILLEKP